MIVIGSCALALLGHKPRRPVACIDLIGTQADIEGLRAALGERIVAEEKLRDYRHAFVLKEGEPFRRVELDFEQTESDRMLAGLCPRRGTLLGLSLQVPSLELLYLLKRSQANIGEYYGKAVGDILHIKPLIGTLGETDLAFYKMRKKECAERRGGKQRFALSISNDEFFRKSGHMREYVHDDLHETVAFTPGQPLFRKCKRDLSLAKIDTDMFEALSFEDRLRMVQEEFMVIGLERFFIPNRSIPRAEVYARGMHKTIRELFVGYFQDFCIDHVVELSTPPPFDFVERFLTAEREGRIRRTDPAPPPPGAYRQIQDHLQKRNFDAARQLAERLAERPGGETDFDAALLLGIAHWYGKDMISAERAFRRCVALQPADKDALFFLGATLCRNHAFAEAADVLREAARRGAQRIELYVSLGSACEALGSPADAADAYNAALRMQPDNPALRAKAAKLRSAAGIRQQAV
ncbi:MAG: tetratricopeptide repeat protein [Novosphingobium sp.]|nr:tetratricopeptide repeat protein [Novosphingobium sp.]